MSILSEEKKEGLRNGACDDYFEARPQIDSNDRRRVFEAGFDRACKAIEAAVLEAQKQEPVAFFDGKHCFSLENTFQCDKPPYAAPVVQPDMVLVPREPTEAILSAMARGYSIQSIYRAMIVAAEGKK